MEGAKRRKQQKQQQQGGHQAELGDGRTPSDPEPQTRASEGDGNAAADPSSGTPATGLEAVRMRLRERLAAKPGGGEGGDVEQSTM